MKNINSSPAVSTIRIAKAHPTPGELRKKGIIPAQKDPCIMPYGIRDEKGMPIHEQGEYAIGRDT